MKMRNLPGPMVVIILVGSAAAVEMEKMRWESVEEPDGVSGKVHIARPAAQAQAGADADAEAAAPDQVKPMAEAGVEPDARMLGFRVRPSRVYIRRYIYFTEDGAIRRAHESFNIHFDVFHSPSIAPLAYQNLKITRMVTDTGRELHPEASEERHALHPQFRHNERHPSFSFSIDMEHLPPPGALSIAECSGTMEVLYGAGVIKEAVFTPFEKIAGKRARIRGLSEPIYITVSRWRDDWVQIAGSQKDMGMIADVTLANAQGEELEYDGLSRSYGGDRIEYRFRVDMPDQGRVILSFFTEIKKVEVPFTVNDIPLRKPREGNQRFEITLRARKPSADRETASDKAAAAKPPEGDLEVVLEADEARG